MKRRYGMSFDTELIDQVDHQRGLVPRTAWIEDAIREKIVRGVREDAPRGSAPVKAAASAPNGSAAAKARAVPIPKGAKR